MGCFKVGNPGDNGGCDCSAACTVARTFQPTVCVGFTTADWAAVSVSVTGPGGTTTGTIASGSTSITFTGLVAGSYTGTVTGAAGYSDATFSFTILVTCLPSTGTINVTMTPDATHGCCSACGHGLTKKTAYITDANGTWTATQAVSGSCSYTTTATVTKNVASFVDVPCSDGAGGTCYRKKIVCSSGSVDYHYSVSNSTGTWRVSVTVNVAISPTGTGCFNTPTDTCYTNLGAGTLAGPVAGTECSGATRPASVTFNSVAAALTGTCDRDSLSLSGSIGSWGIGLPADGPPVSGSIVISDV